MSTLTLTQVLGELFTTVGKLDNTSPQMEIVIAALQQIVKDANSIPTAAPVVAIPIPTEMVGVNGYLAQTYTDVYEPDANNEDEEERSFFVTFTVDSLEYIYLTESDQNGNYPAFLFPDSVNKDSSYTEMSDDELAKFKTGVWNPTTKTYRQISNKIEQ